MNVRYLNFSAEINTATTEQLIAVVTQFCNEKVEELHLLLSTQGGSVMCGFNIYNIMRSLPIKLIVHNMGNVDSIGTIVFLAGEERYACPHSTFMFHGVGIEINQPIRLDEKIMKERLTGLEADNKRISNLLAERTKLSTQDAGHLFVESGTKDASWGEGVGMINSISGPDIPKGVPVHSLVFQRKPI